MRRLAGVFIIAAGCTWASIAGAGGNAGPHDWVEQHFKLDAETGCWHAVSAATVFTGRLRAGAYVGIQMVTIGPDGFPVTPDQEERSPALDAPVVPGPAGQSWFGPLPATKDYAFMFSPRASFGSAALVTICGRTAAPQARGKD
jgi:hypothetical protein